MGGLGKFKSYHDPVCLFDLETILRHKASGIRRQTSKAFRMCWAGIRHSIDNNPFDQEIKSFISIEHAYPHISSFHPKMHASWSKYVVGLVIIGAGPAGLAIVACLNVLSTPNIILERKREECSASLWKRRSYDRSKLMHLDLALPSGPWNEKLSASGRGNPLIPIYASQEGRICRKSCPSRWMRQLRDGDCLQFVKLWCHHLHRRQKPILGKLKYVYGDSINYVVVSPDVGPFLLKNLTSGSAVIDVGTVKQIKSGKIQVVEGLSSVRGNEVTFSDSTSHPYDSTVFATGYKSTVNS